MTEISGVARLGVQQPQQLSLYVHMPADVPITQVKGFIYVPKDDGAGISRLIDRQIVPVQKGAVTILTFYEIEFSKKIEFQIIGVNSANNEILAGRRGYAKELIDFAAKGGIQLTKV